MHRGGACSNTLAKWRSPESVGRFFAVLDSVYDREFTKVVESRLKCDRRDGIVRRGKRKQVPCMRQSPSVQVADDCHAADCSEGAFPVDGAFARLFVVEDPLRPWVLLGHVVGQLRESFGRADADTHRHTNPLPCPLTHLIADFTQLGHTRQIDKAFVNRIHLGSSGKIS